MSDTSAPAAPPPSAPAPASEPVIDTNPVNIPTPIGSQAPERDPAEGRREAIQRAFDRASKPQQAREKTPERAPARAADPKPGHNRPPEETPKEAPPKLDLKKRPQPEADAQPRDRGRFAPRQRDENQQPENGAPLFVDRRQQGRQQAGDYERLPQHAPHANPPQRMAEHGKRDWAKTPETVRGEVNRMHQEFTKASQYYKATHEAYKPIARFDQMARQHGTTLERALTNYTSMETKLREDPVAGLDVIVNNLGLTAPDGSRIGLRDIAYHVLSQSPEQLRQLQQGNQQTAAQHQIGSLHQEIAGLKTVLQQMHTQQRFTHTRSAVDQFADAHPRFDELGDLIEEELQRGYDLNTAYRRAELLRPAAHAPQTRDPSAQTRQPDRSISGSPAVTASNAAARRPREASQTPRSAVENAIRRVNGL